VARLVVNQHRNDQALEEYERRERQTTRKGGGKERIGDDKLYRVVPTGTGTLRLLLEENGRAVRPDVYQKELRELEKALLNALHPAEARQQQAIRTWEKRTRERRELVDALRQAFRFSWLGRETRNGRTLAKLQLDPNPDFKPAARNVEMFTHVRAVLWVEEKEGQVAHLEAEVIRDIAMGGGLLGKVYKGGRFVLDQVETAPGLWFPSRYLVNLDGRKFFFPFSMREASEASAYRSIGSPEEALAAVRRELAAGSAQPARPKPTQSNSLP